MSAPIPAAMLGGGLGSAVGRTHVAAMSLDGAFSLVAGCFSPSADTNAASGVAYGVDAGRVHDDLDTLLAVERDVDVLVVATPIWQHAAQITRALRAGWTVVTDKPTTHDAASARAVVELGEADGDRRLFTLFNYTGYPAVREMRARVRRGDLGRVVRVMAEMPQDSYMRLVNSDAVDRIQSWRLRDGASACVSLDLFVHLHSLLRHVTDLRPTSVQARSRSVAGAAPGLVDDVDALVQLEGGAVLSAWYGKAALGDANGLRLRVYGERGSIWWHQQQPDQLLVHDERSVTRVLDRASMDAEVTPSGRYDRFKPGHPSGFVEAFANVYGDVHDALTGADAPELLTGRVAVEGLQLCEAIAASSARDGRAVALPC